MCIDALGALVDDQAGPSSNYDAPVRNLKISTGFKTPNNRVLILDISHYLAPTSHLGFPVALRIDL